MTKKKNDTCRTRPLATRTFASKHVAALNGTLRAVK